MSLQYTNDFHAQGTMHLQDSTNIAPMTNRCKRKRSSAESHVLHCTMWQVASGSSSIEIGWRINDKEMEGKMQPGPYAFAGTTKALVGRSWVIEAPGGGIQILPQHQVLNPHCEKWIDVKLDNPSSWARCQNVCVGPCQLGFTSEEGGEANDIITSENQVSITPQCTLL